jgi:hypothetical protein
MSVIANIALVAALASSTAAVAIAGTTHLNDAQYLAAARCQGLYNSHALGAVDSTGINRLMKSEGAYRTPDVSDRAAEVMSDAKSEANRAGALSRQALVSERDGACQVWARSSDGETTATR